MKARLAGLSAVGVAVAVMLILVLQRDRSGPHYFAVRDLSDPAGAQGGRASNAGTRPEKWVRTGRRTLNQPAEEVVRGKVSSYGAKKRELAAALAKKHAMDLPPEVARFFDAVESGDWGRIKTAFDAINGGNDTASHERRRTPEVAKLWPAIIDAFGAAEQANLWPAQALLDYGYSIIDSLEPGIVYVGGTDSSRWIPALLNDTEEGDKHVVITQNGLADNGYMDYLRLQFAGRLDFPTEADSAHVFSEYVRDAQARLEHDRNFPDEPKQLRPGEEVNVEDGRVSVGGRIAVFDINERLLNKILELNPELRFAVGESVPMKGTYADAAPLGPLMEVRANGAETFTPERAAESVNHWRETAQFVLGDASARGSDSALKSYAHDAGTAGNLLAARKFHAEAEEAYAIARQLWPGSPATAAQLSELYRKTGRAGEAQALLEQFARDYPAEVKHLKEHWGIEVGGGAPGWE